MSKFYDNFTTDAKNFDLSMLLAVPTRVRLPCGALPGRLSLIYGRRNRGIVHRLIFLYGSNTALYNARFGNIT